MVLARKLGRPSAAQESGFGIVLVGPAGAVSVIRPDGGALSLAAEKVLDVRLDEGGRWLAFVEWHHGRRPWHRVHAVDLADGGRRSLLPDHDQDLAVMAVQAGAVYIEGHRPLGGHVSSLRWVPGADPEPARHPVQAIDPLSGTVLARAGQRDLVVVRPDGRVDPVKADPNHWSVFLSPGAGELHAISSVPPRVAFFQLGAGLQEARVYPLPAGATAHGGRDRPIWEDEEHLLFALHAPSRDGKTVVVRLEARTGRLQRVPLPPDAGRRPLLIQPLLRPR